MGAAAAVIALKNTFGESAVFEGILIFLDDSSHVAICGTGATDIANVADLDCFAVDEHTHFRNGFIQTYLYQGSPHHELW